MRTSILFLGVAIGIGSASVPASACNVRGEFCGYPGWAANAFSSDDERVPDYWREGDLAFGYLAPGYGTSHSIARYLPTATCLRMGMCAPMGTVRPMPTRLGVPTVMDQPMATHRLGSGRVAPGYGYVERRYRWREGR